MSKYITQPTYESTDKHELFVCPYDSLHRVSAKRFPIHLTKCRRIHNAKDFVRCPFNAQHEIPSQELTYHVSTCPDKEIIRQDINPTPVAVPYSSNRPRTPPPSQDVIDGDEDWDTEASGIAFIPANAQKFHDEEKVDSYAVVQAMHEIQSEIHAGSKVGPVDFSKMTAAQKKNYKRSLKRQQKKGDEGGEEEVSEKTEQEKIDELVQKYDLLIDGGGFVDFVSGLNIYCQQNRINVPKYQEGTSPYGGFGYQVIIKSNAYSTNKYCNTKKEAKQNAAMVAMLALDIQFESGPMPNRKNNPLTTKERERMRQTHEQKLLLESSRQTRPQQQQQTRPVAQSSSTYSTQPPVSNHVENPVFSNPPPGFESMGQAMGNLSVQDSQVPPVDDGWTTVPGKKNTSRGVNPVFDYSMKVAGRGRGLR